MSVLDTAINNVVDGYWTTARAAAHGHSALLVEGDDDKRVVEALMALRRRSWATRVYVVPAYGRDRVLKALQSGRISDHCFALVDRDTWTDEEVEFKKRQYPGLFVTEGWCLENSLLSPHLWSEQGAALSEALAEQRLRWLEAGAWWWVIQRRVEANFAIRARLEGDYGAPLTGEEGGQTELWQAWLSAFSEADLSPTSWAPDTVHEAAQRRLAALRALSPEQQWLQGVHGKQLFAQLVRDQLQKSAWGREWFGDRVANLSNDQLKVGLAVRLGLVPAPLDELFAMLLP